MKSILATKPPKIVEGVLNGKISILIFRKFPKDYRGWVYLYCAKPKQNHYHLQKVVDPDNNFKEEYELDYYISFDDYNACLETKVVARFYCDNVEEIKERCYQENMFGGYYEALGTEQYDTEKILDCSGLTFEELYKYINYLFAKKPFYGYIVHISQLEIFDKPKELNEFNKPKNIYGINISTLTKAPKGWQYVEVEER